MRKIQADNITRHGPLLSLDSFDGEGPRSYIRLSHIEAWDEHGESTDLTLTSGERVTVVPHPDTDEGVFPLITLGDILYRAFQPESLTDSDRHALFDALNVLTDAALFHADTKGSDVADQVNQASDKLRDVIKSL